ncbi:hypothetical protein M426DRAFT_321296 [Hypoxylon sp. CI-4A]|nr:hypothetical protein M426DRAFT_321296 [Hypoxylon sp. CI-4A]
MFSKSCALCDVLVDMWITAEEDPANPEHPLSWLQEVRAIRDIAEPQITGVGWLNSEDEVVAPVRYEDHYSDREPLDSLDDFFGVYKVNYVTDISPWSWTYVVHDACWKLLRDRVDPDHKYPVDRLACHLFALLYNTPVNGENGALLPGHNYGHASAFHLPTPELSGRYFTRVNASKYYYITADVAEKFEPNEETLEDEVESRYSHLTRSSRHYGNYSESDPFYHLPSELVLLVLAYLPSRDVCELRSASRYVADLSSPMQLDQKFWSSRFGSDFEMGFVFAGPSNPRPAEPADWRGIYLKAKAALKSELFRGLRNRQRVWQIFHHISDVFVVRLGYEEYIDRCLPYFPDYDPQPWPQDAVYADTTYSELTYESAAAVILSCRLFKWHEISWSQHMDLGTKLRTSFIYSNGKRYISGFRLFSVDDTANELLRAGFINTGNEHEIIMDSHTFIEYIDVAMAMQGLIGLRFYFRSLEDSYSIAVGGMELTDTESGVCRLMPRDNMQCVGFRLGTDACKIISISLEEREAPAFYDSLNQDAGLAVHRSSGPKEVWNPSIPLARPMWHFEKPEQLFSLCLDMDFGGPDGQLLQSLVRIDVLMGDLQSVFLGVSFIYNDGSERFFGRKSLGISYYHSASILATRQCFPINGPRGEVISKLAISWLQNTDMFGIQAIEITTNLGRTREFRLRAQEYIDSTATRILEAEAGKCFTAFHARVQSPLGHFVDFAARCQVVQNRPPISVDPSDVQHTIPITADTLASAQDILAYNQGLTVTVADISRIRRIRVSVDDETSAESRGHISGLWLEYRDSETPVIIGQWIKELDTIDISFGDRITEIATWHDFTDPYKRVKYGHIKKLMFGTLHGIKKEFVDPSDGYIEGNICLQYRENPYEKLSGILWAYNHKWDHVRIFYAPKTTSLGAQLIMDSSNDACPPWAVPQKAFMQEVLNDGRPNPLRTIELTFKGVSYYIYGLTFIYEDGKQVTLGTRGDKEVRGMTLSPGEKLGQMEIGTNGKDNIILISFTTAAGRKMEASRKSIDATKKLVHTQTTYILDRTFSAQPTTVRGATRQFPKETDKHVGFWALRKRRLGGLHFNRFGAIFEGTANGKEIAE